MKQKLLSLLILLAFSGFALAQKAEIRIITQESWPPGQMVPVTVEIDPGNAEGFARFYHRLPNGFQAENVSASGADFFWDNKQVNYVWTSMPTNEIIRIRYKVSADKLLSGSFRIVGRFDYVVNGKERLTVLSEPVLIELNKNARVLEIDDLEGVGYISEKDDAVEETVVVETEQKKEQALKPRVEVDFRIQVSISSNKFSQNELEDRIGVKLKHGFKVLKTASMYKYQSGSFTSYQKAAEYLKELKAGGVDDAFVVAFKDGVQISIKEAEKLLK